VILDGATSLAHNVEYSLPVRVTELASDLSIALAERDSVDTLHLDEEHPDQVLHVIMLKDHTGESKAKLG
jgi:hypothetical protein